MISLGGKVFFCIFSLQHSKYDLTWKWKYVCVSPTAITQVSFLLDPIVCILYTVAVIKYTLLHVLHLVIMQVRLLHLYFLQYIYLLAELLENLSSFKELLLKLAQVLLSV